MMCLYFLFFVAVAHGFVLENARVKRATLVAPTLIRLTAVDPPGFQVDWTPVKSDDAADPILGYKVKVWETPNMKTLKYKLVDGVETLIEEVEAPKVTSNVHDAPPKEYITDKTSILVENVKLNVLYETRVQAYTKSTEGPLSLPMKIKLHKDERAKDLYRTV